MSTRKRSVTITTPAGISPENVPTRTSPYEQMKDCWIERMDWAEEKEGDVAQHNYQYYAERLLELDTGRSLSTLVDDIILDTGRSLSTLVDDISSIMSRWRGKTSGGFEPNLNAKPLKSSLKNAFAAM